MTLKCYILNKVIFQNNLETADAPFLFDREHAVYFCKSSREQLGLIFLRCHAVRSSSSCSIAWRRQWAVLGAGDIEQNSFAFLSISTCNLVKENMSKCLILLLYGATTKEPFFYLRPKSKGNIVFRSQVSRFVLPQCFMAFLLFLLNNFTT